MLFRMFIFRGLSPSFPSLLEKEFWGVFSLYSFVKKGFCSICLSNSIFLRGNEVFFAMVTRFKYIFFRNFAPYYG